jgi:hypothetical protein
VLVYWQQQTEPIEQSASSVRRAQLLKLVAILLYPFRDLGGSVPIEVQPPEAPPLSPAEVSRLRQTPVDDVLRVRIAASDWKNFAS